MADHKFVDPPLIKDTTGWFFSYFLVTIFRDFHQVGTSHIRASVPTILDSRNGRQ